MSDKFILLWVLGFGAACVIGSFMLARRNEKPANERGHAPLEASGWTELGVNTNQFIVDTNALVGLPDYGRYFIGYDSSTGPYGELFLHTNGHWVWEEKERPKSK